MLFIPSPDISYDRNEEAAKADGIRQKRILTQGVEVPNARGRLRAQRSIYLTSQLP